MARRSSQKPVASHGGATPASADADLDSNDVEYRDSDYADNDYRDAEAGDGEYDEADLDEFDDDEYADVDEFDDASEGNDDAALPWLLRSRPIGWVLVVCGAIGFIASFMLTVEFIHKLQYPDDQLICDISPFVTCGPAMLSDAGHLLGFPNVILGLTCFSVTITTGVVTLLGARLPRWYWICFQLGLIGATAIITYLQYFSAFPLGKLCLWCMIIWTGTIFLVSQTTISSMALGRLGDGLKPFGRRLAGWSWVVAVVWYLLVIGLVLAGMWERIALAM